MDTTSTRRVLVIGGSGYYGARVAAVLARLEGAEVHVAGRGATGPRGVRVDVRDPETFQRLRGFDLVVNASDTVNAPPDALAAWCLAQGLTLLEMGADPTTTERLLALPDRGARGTLLVGVGVFPGLSTALAAAAAGLVAECRTLDLGVRLSPLSGAGPGNCDLMLRSLQTPCCWVQDGGRRQGPLLGPARPLPFLGAGRRPAVGLALPDVALVARATGVPTVRAAMALIPGALRFNFQLLAALLPRLGPLRRPALALTGLSLRLMRAILLRRVGSRVQLTAVANLGAPDEAAVLAAFPDGQQATALGVGAAASLLLQRTAAPPPGVYTTADLFPFDALLAEVRRLDGSPTAARMAVTEPPDALPTGGGAVSRGGGGVGTAGGSNVEG